MWATCSFQVIRRDPITSQLQRCLPRGKRRKAFSAFLMCEKDRLLGVELAGALGCGEHFSSLLVMLSFHQHLSRCIGGRDPQKEMLGHPRSAAAHGHSDREGT